ncbi:hypothetical protein J6590_062638 [Homalodisca vitripennis]|nr:hypothetical protein J6590_062638 [Homalodisca vitripennis]
MAASRDPDRLCVLAPRELITTLGGHNLRQGTIAVRQSNVRLNKAAIVPRQGFCVLAPRELLTTLGGHNLRQGTIAVRQSNVVRLNEAAIVPRQGLCVLAPRELITTLGGYNLRQGTIAVRQSNVVRNDRGNIVLLSHDEAPLRYFHSEDPIVAAVPMVLSQDRILP